MSHKCNDYIIKDNEFVRDFEKMYKKIKDPWNQESAEHNHIERLASLTSLISEKPGKILDVGCATGYFSKIVQKIFTKCEYIGTDISPTAIMKASKNFSAKFIVDDIKQNNLQFCKKFDIVFCSKTIYYLAPEIDVVLNNIISYLKDGGVFSCLYNYSKDSFSSKWLNPNLLARKLEELNMKEIKFIKEESENDDNYYLIYEKK